MDWIETLYYFPNSINMTNEKCPKPFISFDDYAEDVIHWAKEKNLLVPENATKQFIKAVEEVGEVAAVIMKNKGKEEAKKEIGDVFVTMIILAEQLDVSYSECLRVAFEKISKRTGETRDGIFVKSEDIH